MNPLLFEPGDPVWVPRDDRQLRGHIVRIDTVNLVAVQVSKGVVITAKTADVRYRYEKGEW